MHCGLAACPVVLSFRFQKSFVLNGRKPKEGSRMRKIAMGIFMLLIVTSTRAQAPNAAVDITAEQIQAFLKTAPPDRNSDRAIRVIDSGGYHTGVFGVSRPKDTPAFAIAHQTNVTEVYYMLEGAGVLVTGGALQKPLKSHSSEMGAWTDVTSDTIAGGVSRRIAKGDVVIIPGGVPHMWASLEGDITYLIVRPDPDKKVPLK
jgi:mannose-6-phosphate isomerase-like protein (cupin superfamily)